MRPAARAFVFVLGSLGGSGMLAEDAFDGAHLKKSCGDYLAADDAAAARNAGAFEMGQCSGFVRGAIAAHALDVTVARAKAGHASARICVPETAGLRDEVRVFQAYLNAHPSKLDWPGVELLYASLLDAWPCPDKPAH